MSRSISVFVRIDRTGNTVVLAVTGTLTPADQEELTRMTTRARTLFPDAAVTVDLSSTRTPQPQEPQRDNTPLRGDGQPEISSAPTDPLQGRVLSSP